MMINPLFLLPFPLQVPAVELFSWFNVALGQYNSGKKVKGRRRMTEATT